MLFDGMRIFVVTNFKLKEPIIKELHNCKAIGYWKPNSVKFNFLLIVQEYLLCSESKSEFNASQYTIRYEKNLIFCIK